ncbi:hypothetical protein ACHAXA_000349 [Cyclostephanos tholiformis]|uniref:Alkyl transferase n=1 Tax=Cyclostephanos tholiformis TaxID=382380 RepID=A0ABD3R4J5_9STRA
MRTRRRTSTHHNRTRRTRRRPHHPTTSTLLVALVLLSCWSEPTRSSSSRRGSPPPLHRATSFAFPLPTSLMTTMTHHHGRDRRRSKSSECDDEVPGDEDVDESSMSSILGDELQERRRQRQRLPRHVAFICDGNSRWSHCRGRRRTNDDDDVISSLSNSIARSLMGHVAGANRVISLIDSLLSIREERQRRYRQPQSRGHAHNEDEEDDDDDALRYCTFFAFSTENWSRPKYEIDAILKLIEDMSRRYRKSDPAIRDGKVRIRILGDIDDARIPSNTREELRALERSSAKACDLVNLRRRRRRRRERGEMMISLDKDDDYGDGDNDDADDADDTDDAGDDALTVCLAINYGGRADILRAATELARSIADDAAGSSSSSSFGSESHHLIINENEITKRLCTANVPDVDLIIRTGGEKRLSNFFLWEGAYAELYFCDTLWPDFDEQNIQRALAWYGQRERRFGGR